MSWNSEHDSIGLPVSRTHQSSSARPVCIGRPATVLSPRIILSTSTTSSCPVTHHSGARGERLYNFRFYSFPSNTSDTDVSKSLLKRLVDSDLTSKNYGTHCLDFAIALCRLEGAKRELVALNAIPKVFEAFVQPFLASDATDPDEPRLVAM